VKIDYDFRAFEEGENTILDKFCFDVVVIVVICFFAF
jgi:hypothetical protein